MGNSRYLISISIPSYNRPKELKRLLESIESKNVNDIEIVICEDNAPKRLEVRKIVEEYKSHTIYNVKYIENPENFGHGKNFTELIKQSDGEYVMYMGDDDIFIPNTLDKFIDFLKQHRECGYILRSYRNLYLNGEIEYFKYYDSDRHFNPGETTYIELYSKSVFMSGFTIKREYVINLEVEELYDTLLYQLYMMAVVCMKYPSAYCNTPVSQGIGDGISYFGSSEREKSLYTPGVSVADNLTYLKNYFRITNYIDIQYNISSTDTIKRNMSKYSYPLMDYARGKGVRHFKQHCCELRKMGLNCTIYFYLYYIGLFFFGAKFCKKIIMIIKKEMGRRPNL